MVISSNQELTISWCLGIIFPRWYQISEIRHSFSSRQTTSKRHSNGCQLHVSFWHIQFAALLSWNVSSELGATKLRELWRWSRQVTLLELASGTWTLILCGHTNWNTGNESVAVTSIIAWNFARDRKRDICQTHNLEPESRRKPSCF